VTSPREVRDALYDLVDGSTITANGSTIVLSAIKCIPLKGQFKSYPVVAIEWVGGPVENLLRSTQIIKDDFNILITHKYAVTSEAEDTVMDICSAIEVIIDANPTLSSTVEFAYVTGRSKVQDLVDGDYRVVSFKLRISSKRYEGV